MFKNKFIKGFLGTMLAISVLTLNLAMPFAGNNKSEPLVPTAYAQNNNDTVQGNQNRPETVNIDKFVEKVTSKITLVNRLFSPLIYFFTFNIGNFLNNDYIYTGNMGTMLNQMWIVSRNVVNIIFVLVLLYLAIVHIFKTEGEGSDLAKLLPKFAIFLIAVNFSWLGAKVVLDAANVATNIIFQMPSGVKNIVGEIDQPCSIDANGVTHGLCSPVKFYFPDNADGIENYKNNDTVSGGGSNLCPSEQDVRKANLPDGNTNQASTTYSKKGVICWEKMDLSKYQMNTSALYLSFSMARVQNLSRTQIGQKAIAKDDNIVKISIGVLFSLILQFVYLVAFLVLVLVLIIRLAVLWILVAFSPFLVLLWFLTKDVKIPGIEAGEFSMGSFVKWAFVPAKVAAVFTVGFLMVTAGQTTDPLTLNINTAGGYIDTKSIFAGMNNMQEFLWFIITVAIVWMGTFAAVGKLPIVGKIVDSMAGNIKSTAKLIGTMPLWTPWLPFTNPITGKKLVLGQFDPREIQNLLVAKRNKNISWLGGGSSAFATNVDKGIDELEQKGSRVINQIKRTNDPAELRNLLATYMTGISATDLTNLDNIEMLRGKLRESEVFKDSADKIANALISGIDKAGTGATGAGAAPPSIEDAVAAGTRKGTEQAASDVRKGASEAPQVEIRGGEIKPPPETK